MNRPNILWIVTTQWRAQATGYAGDANALTPWLDGLASEAVNYTQAVTPHPLGPQARAALLTGRLGPENGVRGYWDALPPDARTVAHALNDRGYATAFFGKWHLAERDRSAALVGEAHARMIVPPERRGGFGLWEGFESGFLLNDPWLHGTRLPQPQHFKGYQADILVQRVAEWLRTPHTQPTFGVVSLEAPHPPYHAVAPHVREMAPAEIRLRGNVPAGGPIERQAREELAGYYAHIEATDRAIGKLIAEVDLAETIVVFTSVHGDMHGSHGLFRKAWPFEESVRVPLLIRGQRPENRGRIDPSPVSIADLPHMAVAWAEGREWHCRRDSALISMPSATEIPLQCPVAWRGFRSAKHKLVLNEDGAPWLYFDLERDPLELKNLAEDPARAGEIAELVKLM
ncbi:Arylsulfatase [Lacunisphaera limnophila]|uniref:Arylsulfatase n=1 Tax=Lacunisphaera limnophila TaxID=1838286 RepID=A0A1I7PHL4_9BACT|nr:sulfatase-like hydrolase/transferase [Lacunisphaera limnophila]AOS43100.1 Arylsulfatase [Lacunisphaera limnophila]